MPQATKITSWSFSRWGVYDNCPAKARYKFLDKLPEPGSPAMDRGSEIHKVIELYLKGVTNRLKPVQNPSVFGPLFRGLRGRRIIDPLSVSVEDTWAYTSSWVETTWNDWARCWVRVKVDCAEVAGTADDVHVSIRDWKTGKFRDNDTLNYGLQLDLYALGALMKYQDAASVTVTPSLVYIDAGVEHSPAVYTKKDLPRLKKEWEKRVRPMLADTKFAPKPNNFCRFCAYRREAGGPCKF